MSTTSGNSSGSQFTLVGKLVAGFIFSHRSSDGKFKRLLKIKFLDESTGCNFDLCTWSPLKAICVYKKLVINTVYKISNVYESQCKEPDRKYSSSKFQITSGHWWVEPLPNYRRTGKTLFCYANLDKAKKALEKGRPVDMVAKFISCSTRGPTSGKTIEGRFAKFIDDVGNLFSVLVWHNIKIDKPSKYQLFNCQGGDIVLIPQMRFSDKSDNKDLTTLFPPVLGSDCLPRRVLEDLTS